jgi:hypothetical protein
MLQWLTSASSTLKNNTTTTNAATSTATTAANATNSFHIMPSQCSPKRLHTHKHKHTIRSKKTKHPATSTLSCLTTDELRKIIREWNTFNPSDHIVIIPPSDNDSDNDSDSDSDSVAYPQQHAILWNSISQKMTSPECATEYCWVKKHVSPTLWDTLRSNFRPEMPKSWKYKNTNWLSTTDIEDVLTQYEEVYNTFTFRGAVPIDFDKVLGDGHNCVSNEVCKLNLRELKKQRKSQIGIVFNLEEHTKHGSHWIAMYVDMVAHKIAFWDSYGFPPPVEVITLIDRLQSQAVQYFGGPYQVLRNIKRHQYKKSECGVYCIYFITQLLAGDSLHDIYNTIISDDNMNQKRTIYYNSPM